MMMTSCSLKNMSLFFLHGVEGEGLCFETCVIGREVVVCGGRATIKVVP